MINYELKKIFDEMATLFDIKEVPFKPRAYEHAAFSIGSLSEDIEEIYKKGGLKALEDIPGIGQGIAERIEEYIKTGHIKDYDKLKKELPVDISGLMNIEGLGPKTIKKLYEDLKIKNIEQLKKAVSEGKLKNLEGFGEKTEQKILKGINFSESSRGRFILGFVMPTIRKITDSLKRLPKVKKLEFAGSIRRMQETIGDLDILVISDEPEKVMDHFVKMPEVQGILSRGETKTSVRLNLGMDADIRVLPPESFGAALQYFTGDKYHNIALREIAIKKGYKLNEYGLWENQKLKIKNQNDKSKFKNKWTRIAGATEEEIYKKLGMNWMEPELRTNSGEIEAAQKDALPKLIGYDDLLGDLHVHTDWSDGELSIEEMAKDAKANGLKYIAISDHTKSLAVAGGLDEAGFKKQMAEIDKVQKNMDGIKILKGVEVDIKKDGTLDIDDETLAQLDVVGVAIHSGFNMEGKEMTERIKRAMENPNADILFHPTGRLINKREPYKVDVDEIIKVAKKTKTILEINAFPSRLDLKDEYVRKAVNVGVKLSIDSDGHAPEHFKYLEFGIGQARRGWAEKNDVINTRDWEGMLKLLK